MASFVGRLQNILVSKWFAVVLISLLLSCLSIFPIANASAQTCGGNWDISGTSGIKTNYQLGETISGNISFKINNPADCPRCIQQILVGLVDAQDYQVELKCIFDGIPQVCPQWTTGNGDFSWKNPNYPGTYRIIAANDHQPSCFDAWSGRYPKIIKPYKTIATITVSASKTDEKAVAPTTPPLPPPTKEDRTTSSTGSGTTQDGGSPTTGSSTQFIIISVVIALLVLLFTVSVTKSRKGRGKKRSQLMWLIPIAAITLIGVWLFGTPFGKLLLIFVACLLVVFGIFKITRFFLTREKAQKYIPQSESRFIPDWIKREVAVRDGNQCRHINWLGMRCKEKRNLEYDHVISWSRGGESTVENLRLLCQKHNRQKGARQQ